MPGWTASAPTTYAVAGDGSYTLYPWAKDATGNVSAVYGSPASVSVDTTRPAVTSFTATSPSGQSHYPNHWLHRLGQRRRGGLSDYNISYAALGRCSRLDGFGPASYSVPRRRLLCALPVGQGCRRQCLGRLRLARQRQRGHNSNQAVSSFAATSPSISLTIPTTAFAASDTVAVTGYKITTSSTPPSAGAAGWTASAPTTYTVARRRFLHALSVGQGCGR